MIRLTLLPDPGVGRHWRLSIEVADVVLVCDVARIDDPRAALAEAERVASALGLVADGPDAWRTP